MIYTRDGSIRLRLPAGRYRIHAGRGFEYSVATADVNLAPVGKNAPVRLTIRREVDTTGWAAMDTHLHTGTHARHGDATVDERLLTLAGEGIELPVSTEHGQRVDFDAPARAAGVRARFTPLLGSEVTTPALGHFNVFPLPAAGPPIDERAADWPRLRESIAAAAERPAIVLNHGRNLHGGFRPLGPERHLAVAGEALDGRVLPANAMEVVNSGAVMTDGLALPRDWMALLNRGFSIAPVGSSDAHDAARYIAGQARTYVRVDDRDPGGIDVARAVDAVRRGRVMVSYGLAAEIAVGSRGPGELAAADGDLAVRIRVLGPGWTRARRVTLYVNGFAHRDAPIADGTRAGVKWEATWTLARPSHDVHLVAIAEGPGVSAPYWPTAQPYQPTSLEFTPYVLGVSGAVFVDADGSGAFESAFEYARRALAGAEGTKTLGSRLAAYDAAVAVQAASLLRDRQPATFEADVNAQIASAPAHVARGLAAYLEAWKAAQRAAGRQSP